MWLLIGAVIRDEHLWPKRSIPHSGDAEPYALGRWLRGPKERPFTAKARIWLLRLAIL